MTSSQLEPNLPEVWKTNPFYTDAPNNTSRPLWTSGHKSLLNGRSHSSDRKIESESFLTDIPFFNHTSLNLRSIQERRSRNTCNLKEQISTATDHSKISKGDMTIRRELTLTESAISTNSGLIGQRKENGCLGESTNTEVEAEDISSILKAARSAASRALQEAVEAREHTLQARKETLAARKDAIEAQTEAMKARNEALKSKREMKETKKALSEVKKAINEMMTEIQRICADTFRKSEYQNDDFMMNYCKAQNGKAGAADTKDEGNNELNSVRLKVRDEHFFAVSGSGNSLPVSFEPKVIITNGTEMGTENFGPSTTQASKHFNTIQNNTIETKAERSLGTATCDFVRPHSSWATMTRRPEIDIEESTRSTTLKKNLQAPSASEVSELDIISLVKRGPDDQEEKESPTNDKVATPPGTGSFAQKWGDFIGRISTLMITIVTAVNTGEAMFESLLSGSYVKAGTFAFLLLFIHIPVATVMVWLLLKEKVQQIKDTIRKARSISMFLSTCKFLKNVQAKGDAECDHIEENDTQDVDEDHEKTATCSASASKDCIFFVRPKKARGIVNEGFIEENGCNPGTT
ncbi:hypothetical protein PoB_006998500 [Plakobranchus ocellatus]|uniref:Transmembrane protein n=1 Tax=Plakobranchus ocellatus TaxID=259542 RepID=A0AAV4DH70_9GAST|nr:hypothetical protein PoB_006998500 [Plakobranchus ocellatus]